MAIYLHKSLCDLHKAGQLATSAGSSDTGEQRGGDYFHRIQTGYTKDNKPQYRYFRTAESWDAYTKEKKKTGKEDKKTGEESAERLKEKTTGEQVESKKKEDKTRQQASLFIKDKKKDKKVKKGLYLNV